MSDYATLRKQYQDLGAKRARLRRGVKKGDVDPTLIEPIQAEMDKLSPLLKAAKPPRPTPKIEVDPGTTVEQLNEAIEAQRKLADQERRQLLKLLHQREYLEAVQREKTRLESLSPAERAAVQQVMGSEGIASGEKVGQTGEVQQ